MKAIIVEDAGRAPREETRGRLEDPRWALPHLLDLMLEIAWPSRSSIVRPSRLPRYALLRLPLAQVSAVMPDFSAIERIADRYDG